MNYKGEMASVNVPFAFERKEERGQICTDLQNSQPCTQEEMSLSI